MTTYKVSRFTVAFGMILLVVVQVMGTNAMLWFSRGKKSKGQSTTENDMQVVIPASTTTTELPKHKFDIDSQTILSGGGRGRQLYEESVALQTAHSCWQEAYTGLESSCRDILKDESKKSRLALRLTNCFLKTSGRPLIKKCPENWPIASCVKDLDDHNHRIFLAFYVDSSAMCHYLQ